MCSLFIGACPYTERAFSSNLSISQKWKVAWILCGKCCDNSNLEILKTCKVFTRHKVKTSSVGFSQNNIFACSGDIEGNLKIWFLDDLSIKKEYNKALGGKINGI